ncbi:MAG: hypothetical protein E7426_05155 [Ruminococcaceae bacterium]|jgi:hypothetical protein|nr:hypothetical protein [Oscillospiraceae bacterium]
MIDYLNLKNSYVAAIQMGLALNASIEEAKRGNDLLHKFCEKCIESSNYSEIDKQNMKHELERIKETLSQEIDRYYHNA